MMKVNGFMLVISLLVSGLIFYGFYVAQEGQLLLPIGVSLLSFITLGVTLSVSNEESPRSSSAMKVASGVFFSILLLGNILLAWLGVSDAVFIVVNGIVLCIWAIVIYAIAKSNQ